MSFLCNNLVHDIGTRFLEKLIKFSLKKSYVHRCNLRPEQLQSWNFMGNQNRTEVYILAQKRQLLTPPLSENDNLSPSCDTTDSHRDLFALILLFFAFMLHFYISSSLFLSPFFLFTLDLATYSSPVHIFSPKWHWLMSLGGRGIFQFTDHWSRKK